MPLPIAPAPKPMPKKVAAPAPAAAPKRNPGNNLGKWLHPKKAAPKK